VVFQSFVFGQILAILDSFGQFWVDFASCAVAESMPKIRLKSLKPHNSLIVSPKVACSNSLERYNPPLHTYKVSRTPQSNCSHSSVPKSAKNHFGSLACLGVNSGPSRLEGLGQSSPSENEPLKSKAPSPN
jgi:hypothetical protein